MDTNVLHNLSYGMYIVSSNKGDLLNGQIANTVFQITSEPVTIAISINNKNLTHEYIEASSRFSLSILNEKAPLSFIGKFGFRSGRTEDKFKGTNFIKLASGCPVALEYTLCYIEAKVVKKLDCFTHTLFIGEMTDSKMLKTGRPMTYDYYHQEKRGTTPSSAPTFIKEETPDAKKPFDSAQGFILSESEGNKEVAVQKYRCVICNYVYDPAIGDPDGGIQPGTPFEKIPNSWVCPICGADKSQFEKEN